MTVRERKLLRTLDEIGGEVAEDELVHHLGKAAVYDAFEAAELGLDEAQTTFTLTDAGWERLGSAEAA